MTELERLRRYEKNAHEALELAGKLAVAALAVETAQSLQLSTAVAALAAARVAYDDRIVAWAEER